MILTSPPVFPFSFGRLEKHKVTQPKKSTKTQVVAAATVGMKQAKANGKSKLRSSIF
jgi:hypothetical protein